MRIFAESELYGCLDGAGAAARGGRAVLARITESARTLVAKSQLGLREGQTTVVEVLEATRALREVEQEAVEARQRLAEAQAAVLRASGRLLGEER